MALCTDSEGVRPDGPLKYEVPYRAASPVSDFFFHAEDGIRDLIVTGVQTCALPI